MPTVKLAVGDVVVELSANEVTVEALGKQAVELLTDAAAALPPRNTVGFGGQYAERRWTPDHLDTKYGRGGFEPVQARGQAT